MPVVNFSGIPLTFPDDMPQEQIDAIIKRDAPSLRKEYGLPEPERTGFLGGASQGVKSGAIGVYGDLTGGVTTGAGAAFGSDDTVKSGIASLERTKQLQREAMPDPRSFAGISKTFEDQGIVAGLKELPGYIGETLGTSAAYFAPSLAAAKGAAALTPPVLPFVGPFAKPIAGAIAGVGTGIAQFFGSNIGAQVEEGRRTADALDPGSALAAAVPQAALNYAELAVLGLTGGLGRKAVTETTTSIIAAVTKGIGKNILVEVPAEVTQEVLERWQAGLPLDDDKAIAAYKESAAGAVIGGTAFGGVAGAVEGRQQNRDAAMARFDRERREAEEEAKKNIAARDQLLADNQTLPLLTDQSTGSTEPLMLTQRLDPQGTPENPTPGPTGEGGFTRATDFSANPAGLQTRETDDQGQRDERNLARMERERGERAEIDAANRRMTVTAGKETVTGYGPWSIQELGPDLAGKVNQRLFLRGEAPKDTFTLDDLRNGNITEAELARLIALQKPVTIGTGVIQPSSSGISGQNSPSTAAATSVPSAASITPMGEAPTTAQLGGYLTPETLPKGAAQDYVVDRLPVRRSGWAAFTGKDRVSEVFQTRKQAVKAAGKRKGIQIRNVVGPSQDTEGYALVQRSLDGEGNVLGRAPVATFATQAEAQAALDGNTPTLFPPKPGEARPTTVVQQPESATRDYVNPVVDRVAKPGIIVPRSPLTDTRARLADPGYRQRVDALGKALRKQLTGYGLSDVKLTLTKMIASLDGKTQPDAEGVYRMEGLKRTIRLATRFIDPKATPEQQIEQLAQVMDHEVVHALREMGLFTPREWRVLVQHASPFLGQVQESHAGLSNEELQEEAVAEAFRAFAKDKRAAMGMPRSLLQRIVEFFKGLARAVRGANAQDIFSAIQRGDVGRRERQLGSAEPAEKNSIRPSEEQGMASAWNAATKQARGSATVRNVGDMNRALANADNKLPARAAVQALAKSLGYTADLVHANPDSSYFTLTKNSAPTVNVLGQTVQPPPIKIGLRLSNHGNMAFQGGNTIPVHLNLAPLHPNHSTNTFQRVAVVLRDAKVKRDKRGDWALFVGEDVLPVLQREKYSRVPTYYSAMREKLLKLGGDKQLASAWLGRLKNMPGVKPEELEWSGVQDFLENRIQKERDTAEFDKRMGRNAPSEKPETITLGEIIRVLDENSPNIEVETITHDDYGRDSDEVDNSEDLQREIRRREREATEYRNDAIRHLTRFLEQEREKRAIEVQQDEDVADQVPPLPDPKDYNYEADLFGVTGEAALKAAMDDWYRKALVLHTDGDTFDVRAYRSTYSFDLAEPITRDAVESFYDDIAGDMDGRSDWRKALGDSNQVEDIIDNHQWYRDEVDEIENLQQQLDEIESRSDEGWQLGYRDMSLPGWDEYHQMYLSWANAPSRLFGGHFEEGTEGAPASTIAWVRMGTYGDTLMLFEAQSDHHQRAQRKMYPDDPDSPRYGYKPRPGTLSKKLAEADAAISKARAEADRANDKRRETEKTVEAEAKALILSLNPDAGAINEIETTYRDKPWRYVDGMYLSMYNAVTGRSYDAELWLTQIDRYPGLREMFNKLEAAEDAVEKAYDKLTKAREVSEGIENPHGVADAPWKKTWTTMLMKAMIRYAAESGLKRITWPSTYEQVAKIENHPLPVKVNEAGKVMVHGRNMTSIYNRYTQDLGREMAKFLSKYGVQVGKFDMPETAFVADEGTRLSHIDPDVANGTFTAWVETNGEIRDIPGDYPTEAAARQAAREYIEKKAGGSTIVNGFEINDKLKDAALNVGFEKFSKRKPVQMNQAEQALHDRFFDSSIKPTMKERFAEWSDWKRTGMWLRQQVVDKFAPLEAAEQRLNNGKTLRADLSAFAAGTMAARSSHINAQAIMRGAPTMYSPDPTNPNSTWVKVVDGVSIMSAMKDIVTNGLESQFKLYALAKRGARLQDPGQMGGADKVIEIGLTQQEIATGLAIGTQYPDVAKAFAQYQEYNKNLLKFAKDSGFISQTDMDKYLKWQDYYGFYRQIGEDQVQGPRKSGGIGSEITIHAIKGGEEKMLADPIEVMIRNSQFWIDASMRTIAARKALALAETLGEATQVPRGQGNMRTKINGKVVEYRVDDPMWVTALGASEANNIPWYIEKMALPARWLREAVTRDPGFMLANMVRDTAATWVARPNVNIIPFLDTVKGFKDANKEGPLYRAMASMGAVGRYDMAVRPAEDISKLMKEEIAANGRVFAIKDLGAKNAVMHVWHWLGKKSEEADAATRGAVYADVLKRTGNEAEAAFQALEVLNFSRRGASMGMQVMTMLIPFLNARIQGMDVIARGVRENPARLLTRGAGLMAVALAVMAAAEDDEDWKNADPHLKDGNVLIPLKWFGLSGGLLAIPKPFEIGLLFQTIPEHAINLMRGKESLREVRKTLFEQAGATLGYTNIAGVPVPQALAPLIEVGANKNFFTGRPVEPASTADLPKNMRYDRGTSELSKGLGQVTDMVGLSPAQLDRLMRGYSGTMGSYLLDATSVGINFATGGNTGDPYNLPIFRRFVKTSDNMAIKNIGDLYELHKDLKEVTGAMSRLKAQGQIEKADAMRESKGELLSQKASINARYKQLVNLTKQEQMILNTPDMPSAERLAALREIKRAKIAVVEGVEDINRAAGR
jgi:hypothetical protein